MAVILLVTAVLSSIVAVLSKGDSQTPASVFQSAVENFIKTQRVLTLVNDTLLAFFNDTTADAYLNMESKASVDVKLRSPFTCVVAGPTSSGKS